MVLKTYTTQTENVNAAAVMDAIEDAYPQFWTVTNDPFPGARATDVILNYDGTTLSIVIDDSVTDTALDAIVAANPASIESKAAAIEANRTALAQDVRDRIVQTLVQDTVSGAEWNALYNDARTFVVDRPKIVNVVTNLVALHDLSTGGTTDVTTTAGKATYLRKLIEAIALYS